jgi:glycerate 2-kinase
MTSRRDHALSIWQAAVAAADPFARVRDYLAAPGNAARAVIASGGKVAVLGGGKAGALMAAGVEAGLADHLDAVTGFQSVPGGSLRPLSRIALREARPAGSNHPTAEGVAAVEEQFRLADSLMPGDLALCLLSGGGSALLPAPAEEVSLRDKQEVTQMLHASGATIDEMNCVRKHLSRYKGGRLAQRLVERGVGVLSLILSDVVGDPLDVIASGPTAPDPTTFADALAVLDRFGLAGSVPPTVLRLLERGASETPKSLPDSVTNIVLINNAGALAAAAVKAESLGYRVINLGPYLEGETRHVADILARILRGQRGTTALLSGGETTVTLGPTPGKGGRNQEFVLACLVRLGLEYIADAVILSAGTDGEDGPTDAAGAIGDRHTLLKAHALGLEVRDHLDRHDAYPFFDATGDLLRTGLTQTNVMDVRVMLVG